MSDLQHIRKEYISHQLDIDNLDDNPIVQFRYWLNEAIRSEVPEPTAMAL